MNNFLKYLNSIISIFAIALGGIIPIVVFIDAGTIGWSSIYYSIVLWVSGSV